MPTERIYKALANCEQGLSEAEKAQCRENIGAQGALTAGPNIDIISNIISTEKPRVEAGTNVSVGSVLDPQTRVITYTISATGSSVSATPPIYGDGTAGNPLKLKVSHGLSLVQPIDDDTYLQVTTPVPAPGSTSANKVLTCADSLGNLEWRQLLSQTGNATHPVFVNSNNEIGQCDESAFEGTRQELVMASSVTLDGTSNEQDWSIAAQHGWPYGWSSYRFEWNGIVTSSENITVRFYERTFSYSGLDGSFTPDAEKLLATAYLRSGTGSVNLAFTTTGWPNRKWLSGLRVTVQPDSASSDSVTLTEQAGSYTPINSGAEIITIPNAQPSGPWTPPNP